MKTRMKMSYLQWHGHQAIFQLIFILWLLAESLHYLNPISKSYVTSRHKDNEERDNLVKQMFKRTIMKNYRRYRVSCPWKTQNQNLPEYYELSLGRLKTLMTGLETDCDLLQCYNKITEDQLSKESLRRQMATGNTTSPY